MLLIAMPTRYESDLGDQARGTSDHGPAKQAQPQVLYHAPPVAAFAENICKVWRYSVTQRGSTQ